MCVSMAKEESCTDWIVENDHTCWYYDDDIRNQGVKDLNHCQDLCQLEPKCIAVMYNGPHNPTLPLWCWLKSKLDICHPSDPYTLASLVHYDCRDNHNCGGSFVNVRDKTQGQLIGQSKSYCGRERPDDFYSIGQNAEIRIQVDSTSLSSGPPEYRAKIKAERCNRILTDANGFVASPGYPYQYPKDIDCRIELKVDVESVISIFFVHFELENSQNCESDWLQINSRGRLCGNKLPNPVFNLKSPVNFLFHSNSALEGIEMQRVVSDKHIHDFSIVLK